MKRFTYIDRYNDNNLILLHVPKTGGTSLKMVLIQNQIPFCELHINRKMESGAAILLDDILNSDKKVILTWRNPILSLIHI